MSKKDTSKILTTGTPKQRLQVLAEDIARDKYQMDKLLTDKEFTALSQSFKKPNEIKLYERFRKVDAKISDSIDNLTTVMFEVNTYYSNLRGQILAWNYLESSELLVNSVLHEIEDPNERMRIAEKASKKANILFGKAEPDSEGYIDIKVDFKEREVRIGKHKIKKDYSLMFIIQNSRKQATEQAIKFMSWRRAILEYMEEEGFNIKTYKDKIDKITQRVITPVISSDKYLTELKSFIPEAPSRRDKLKAKYSVTPDMNLIEQGSEEDYNWYKKNVLK